MADEINGINVSYDPDGSVSWGYWKCLTCEDMFYDSKVPVHSCNGSSRLVYFIPRKEAVAIIREGRSVYSPVRTRDLERSLAALVEEIRGEISRAKRS